MIRGIIAGVVGACLWVFIIQGVWLDWQRRKKGR